MNRPTQTPLAYFRTIKNFAILNLDRQQWLIPQKEIQSLEALLSIDRDVRAPGSIGAIGFEGEWWPSYCLSGELQILPQLPSSRRVCLLLNNGADCFGLICDQVETLTVPPRLFALPACMALPDSPIQALALLEHRLGYVTTTEHMAALIAMLAEKSDV